MNQGTPFLIIGGGTGGHVIPAIAVARELRDRGHAPLFIGTRNGFEARLVPENGFPIDWIEIGGLKRVGLLRTLQTLAQLPLSIGRVLRLLELRRPAAAFSMGGYVAGPVTVAAWLRRIPVVLMEPNAMPGLTARLSARFVRKALVSFEESARFFRGKAEITGLPVRPEFFGISRKPREETLTILITGGSRGSRTLNNAARASWPLFRDSGTTVRIIHQAGLEAHAELAREFAVSGLEGEVVPFLTDMPGAFARADLVVSRSGAGAVAELAAARKPSILCPFPFAADDHQLRNAEALQRAGAARLVLDREMTGERLFQEIAGIRKDRAALDRMSEAVARFARPGAAQRAADLLEELGNVRAVPESQVDS
jgi:UDP-N-acetylglucosamine--N-acetylmuramyl-(pentapeptide) pyrophosphoryl-undecaprenol N-acetylglucosamine transferase